jgi:hypothetical protein
MPIQGQGWEIHIERVAEQENAQGSKRRTVDHYRVYWDGQRQEGKLLSGTMAETKGPGANQPAGNNQRIEEGRYPLYTQDGKRYATIGYVVSDSPAKLRKPSLELMQTGKRKEILIHPGYGFLSSVGCFNPSVALAKGSSLLEFGDSRERTIALIDNLRAYLGDAFPAKNGHRIPNAFAVVDGEPPSLLLARRKGK